MSPECWELYGEVTAHELIEPALVRDLHQLTVDAYQTQHPGSNLRGLIYGLVGLHMGLDLGIRGTDVRTAHARMGPTEPHWPLCAHPPNRGSLTVADVALAGSPDEHRRLVSEWAGQIWQAWQASHDAIARLTQSHVLPLVPEARRRVQR